MSFVGGRMEEGKIYLISFEVDENQPNIPISDKAKKSY